jgi:hypothetical protein
MVKVRRPYEESLRATLDQIAQAEALLIANQAAFVANMNRFEDEIRRTRQQDLERFQRIESILLGLLEVLPEALRERIGFPKKK